MVIAGDVKPDDVKRLVTKYFAWIPRQATPARPTYAPPPPQRSRSRSTTTDDVQVPRVYIAFRGPAAYSPDEAPLDMAASILGDGKSSRLYKRLVYDEKIAQNVRADDETREIGGEFADRRDREAGHRSEAAVAARSTKRSRSSQRRRPIRRSSSARSTRTNRGSSTGSSRRCRARSSSRTTSCSRTIPITSQGPRALSRGDAAAGHRVRPRSILKPSARVVLTINPGKKPAEEPK